MSIAPTLFVAGNTFTAADLLSRVTTVEDFINGGTATGDLEDASPWAKSQHFVRPEFYGSPHPRVQLITGLTAYRRRSGDWYQAFMLSDDAALDTWVPVHGLCATLLVQPPPGVASINVVLRAGFYAYERDGTLAGRDAAIARLFKGTTTPYQSTERLITSNAGTIGYRCYHSMEKVLPAVTRGVHNVGVALWINSGASPRLWNRIWVKNAVLSAREHHR